jgi:hypothetical protein
MYVRMWGVVVVVVVVVVVGASPRPDPSTSCDNRLRAIGFAKPELL